MTHIAQIIAQEIYQQLKQTLQQTGSIKKESQNSITYTRTINQQDAQITLNDLNKHFHIQLRKHPIHWELPITITDIIIDEQNIHIRTYNNTEDSWGSHILKDCGADGQLTYELTDPQAIQNAIQTITQIL